MVTDTRTTPTRPESPRLAQDNAATTSNQSSLWIVLAVVAFAALGYAFYHYSNSPDSSMANTPSGAVTQQSAPAATPSTTDGTVMNNDTTTAPNTVTPAAPATTTDSTTNSSSTAQ